MAEQIVNLRKKITKHCSHKHEATISFEMNETRSLCMVQ